MKKHETHHSFCENKWRHRKRALGFGLLTLTALLLNASTGSTFAQSDQDLIEVARGVVRADRQAVVVGAMDLTSAESEKFWPLYRDYRTEMDRVSDSLVKLVMEYAKVYPNVPDERAKQWL